ncbi:hypothetical protein BJ508DRAFT_414421 [Ascobolus immersus RN42]|uniref:Uncharacterized protein n=1 Tax=Ascobolus immersus RN42 TaxID=1160509 RepID=A0A3N4I8Z7_ASCIM|nr:hypothetical protein BJ508DRAFT_414421 [Ascobolus immersus RN42]
MAVQTTPPAEVQTPDAATAASLDRYTNMRRNLAYGLLVACPLIAMLPPRRMNLQTAGLAGLWALGAREVAVGDSLAEKRKTIVFGGTEEEEDEILKNSGRGVGDEVKSTVWGVWNQEKK